ncbi:hypothetical protein HHK36_022178 [Tetracentron sinense]|uniref:Uncharacterized protein n=1 Tax=Tetracentron sinense TaxID=13715 RepID=A0A834YQA7_TETSI|nr:hypothetical protein HHK36_022178 [Tetracentron sinense]
MMGERSGERVGECVGDEVGSWEGESGTEESRGTGGVGLVATMLSAPDNNNRPLFATKDITKFYLDNCPKIFPQNRTSYISSIKGLFGAITGPKYDGRYLHAKGQELLSDMRIDQALTDVVIPTFDIKLLKPTIFSAFEARKDVSMKGSSF